MSNFNKEKLSKAKDVFSNFNDVLIKGNSFSGPASFSPVTTTKAAFGNFINRQSIQLYHVNDSAIVDNSKRSYISGHFFSPEEAIKAHKNNLNVLFDTIRQALSDPNYNLGQPGVMIRSIPSLDGVTNASEAHKKIAENAGNDSYINITGVPKPTIDENGKRSFESLTAVNSSTIIEDIKKAIANGQEAETLKENGTTLNEEQNKYLQYYNKIKDVLNKMSDKDFIVDVTPTSRSFSVAFNNDTNDGASREMKLRNELMNTLENQSKLHNNEVGVINSEIATRTDYKGPKINEDYTVLKNGVVLNEYGEKVPDNGKSEIAGTVVTASKVDKNDIAISPATLITPALAKENNFYAEYKNDELDNKKGPKVSGNTGFEPS